MLYARAKYPPKALKIIPLPYFTRSQNHAPKTGGAEWWGLRFERMVTVPTRDICYQYQLNHLLCVQMRTVVFRIIANTGSGHSGK